MNKHVIEKLLLRKRFVKTYLKDGGDPNISVGRGRTLLHYYTAKGDLETVRLLLSRGADPNARDDRGRTPLHYAVKADDEVVVELIKAGADVNARDGRGRTPLHWAVAARNNAETLLYFEANPNVQDVFGNTPLHYAVLSRNDYDVRQLLEYFADPRIRNKRCMSPIDLARKKRFYELVELMEEAVKRRQQAAPKMCASDKRTQLHEAVAKCNPEEVGKLLHPWVDRDACDEEGRTPLHYAVMCGGDGKDAEIVKMLLRPWPRASPNVKDVYGRTPLHYAVLSGNSAAVKILLEHYADPTIPDNEGKTPLDYARGHVAGYVVYLLERWAHIWRLAASRKSTDPDAACYRVRCSDLFKASRFGYLLCVKNLLDAGADPNMRNDLRETPLHYAAMEGHAEVVKMLLKHGANPNVRDFLGYTPLHYAAAYGRAEVVKLLLEHGANPSLKTVSGDTPLHYVAEGCEAGAAELLLKHGADPTAKNAKGETPVDVARRQYEKYRGYCDSPYSCWTWRREIEECAATFRVLTAAAT
ncbi:MAG: ankyrin repeat domain-containing protein [Pyrobaculum sp.]|jgi:ankyrin repeat protein